MYILKIRFSTRCSSSPHEIMCMTIIDCGLSHCFRIQDKMKRLVDNLRYVRVVWQVYSEISNLSPRNGSG